MQIKFGETVKFDEEYVSCNPNTVTTSDSECVEKFFNYYNIGVLEEIKSKKIHKFKEQKVGIFLGKAKINLSFYYDFNDFTNSYYAVKSDFIEVAEVRCENIKKSYYVPLNNIKYDEIGGKI